MYVVSAAAQSEQGPYRKANEDAYCLDPQLGLYVVADGMGGQQAGECASRLAVEQIHDFVRRYLPRATSDEQIAAVLRKAVIKANDEIMSLAAVEPCYHGMGTTVVFALVGPDRAYVGGIGDSRCYHWRNGTLRQLTEDHSLIEALKKIGNVSTEALNDSRLRHTLYRFLGCKEATNGPDILVLAPLPGDRLLLTTDGLTGVVNDDRIRQILGEHSNPDAAAKALVQEALQRGSRDNITCIAIYFEPSASSAAVEQAAP